MNKLKIIDEYLERLALACEFRGTVLIAKKGEILFKKGFGEEENRIDTAYQIASVSKQFTAASIMKLH